MYSSRPSGRPLVTASASKCYEQSSTAVGAHRKRIAFGLKTSVRSSERMVSLYYAHLQHAHSIKAKQLLAVAPSMTQKLLTMSVPQMRAVLRTLKIESKPYIWLQLYNNTPAAAGYIHCSLLLMARPVRFLYFNDSLEAYNMKMAQNVLKTYSFSFEDFKLVFGRYLQLAGNEDSCVHVMCLSDVLADSFLRCEYLCNSVPLSKDSVMGIRQNSRNILKSLGGILSRIRAALRKNFPKPKPRFHF